MLKCTYLNCLLLLSFLWSIPCSAQYQSILPTDSLLFWVRSDTGLVKTGTDVNQWNDLSGHQHHAVTDFTTAPQEVLNELNGHPVVRFNGTTTAFKTSAMKHFANKRGTIFIVARTNGPGNSSSGFGSIVSTWVNSGITFQFGASMNNYHYFDGVGTVGYPIASAPPNQWGILTLKRAYNDTMHLYKSGVQIAAASIANNQPDSLPMYIGYSGSYEVYNGDIAEIIIYNRALNAQEMIQVNAYLANRYAFNQSITSPSSQNQASCGPANFVLTATGGHQYHWYRSPSGGERLYLGDSFPTGMLHTSDTFYVANYNDTLESSRTQVIAHVHPLPATPIITQVGNQLLVNSTDLIQWYFNGNIIANATDSSLLPSQVGIYTVSVTDSNNCSSSSAPFSYTNLDAINVQHSTITYFPNPCQEKLHIEFSDLPKQVLIKIVDTRGSIMNEQSFEQPSAIQLNTQTLPQGLYWLSILVDDRLEVYKFIKS